ncbi:hypothetical protein KGD83_17610 [Nocardiopsis akebiae]|uniref:Uncharacterized protein n=1 Tax=Nocardiopsis akebiae TaxID=2831968 RepID=A0ABX8BYD7_9ACTN|nr:hypothetical protein [Nocardiopsis akebiae]QUX27151.1 hypothetical protein KGD83_17610 [Nocardiopsis akebiae]
METSTDRTRIQPSGICRRGHHQWRHDPPGGKRLLCTRCKSMSMTNYGECREDCVDCHPPACEVGGQ